MFIFASESRQELVEIKNISYLDSSKKMNDGPERTGFLFGVIPQSERDALIAIYNSTHGEGWSDSSGWKTPPLHADGFAMPGTEKYGKEVIVNNVHVISISCTGNNLTGTLPAQLGDLSKLTAISLSPTN